MTAAVDCVTAHMSGIVFPFFSESIKNVWLVGWFFLWDICLYTGNVPVLTLFNSHSL